MNPFLVLFVRPVCYSWSADRPIPRRVVIHLRLVGSGKDPIFPDFPGFILRKRLAAAARAVVDGF